MIWVFCCSEFIVKHDLVVICCQKVISYLRKSLLVVVVHFMVTIQIKTTSICLYAQRHTDTDGYHADMKEMWFICTRSVKLLAVKNMRGFFFAVNALYVQQKEHSTKVFKCRVFRGRYYYVQFRRRYLYARRSAPFILVVVGNEGFKIGTRGIERVGLLPICRALS